MKEFESYSELHQYIYNMSANLTNSRMDLSKKLEKQLEKDILDDYNKHIKLMQYNDRFYLRLKFKQLRLDRLQMRKEFKEYRKSFMNNVKLKKPVIKAIYDNAPIDINTGVLPTLSFESQVTGKISWDFYVLKKGKSSYSWTFVPDDIKKYSILKGTEQIIVIANKKKSKSKKKVK